MTHKPKIAFVVQRCGKEVSGGAEAYCLQIAQLMNDKWDIEILTTCALDYMSWENYYDAGLILEEGVKIRRFKVDATRNIEEFNEFSSEIYPNVQSTSIKDAEKWMELQGPNSNDLLSYIEAQKSKYDGFIFFTYLYATTYFGLPLVKEKSYLASFSHDEPPIYLPIWDKWFRMPQKIIYSTIEEKEFLHSRFDKIKFFNEAIGIGIDVPKDISNIRFRQKYDIYSPYILYVGRIDASKGCSELFELFLRFKESYDAPLKLVLAGKTILNVPDNKDIIALGFIDEMTKFDAIDGCEFLINPSQFESLSMVLLEAWSVNVPVLVNAKAKVMVGQCKRSKGGLTYHNYDEFEINVKYLLKNRYKYINMHKFVSENYSWKVIKNKFLRVINPNPDIEHKTPTKPHYQ